MYIGKYFIDKSKIWLSFHSIHYDGNYGNDFALDISLDNLLTHTSSISRFLAVLAVTCL